MIGASPNKRLEQAGARLIDKVVRIAPAAQAQR